MDFLKFCSNCDEVTLADGVATFTGFHAERDDYHVNRTYWVIPFDEVVETLKEYADEFGECQSDEERVEFLEELGKDIWACGGMESRISDCDTLSYNIKSVDYSYENESLPPLKDYDEFCYVEDCPYRYGTYSGVYNLHTGEFDEFNCDGESSPCGGPDYAGFNVTPQLLVKLMEALD